ncbi:TPA: SGNH/GDSL hydrolase family protein, partial [Escherichia coli]
MSEYDTGNPVPSASMPDAWDNMQSIDKFVNSSDETITTRTGEQLDTLHGVNVKADNQLTQQQADFETSQEERDAVVEETRQNLIPLSRQYMTLAAAQADIANIPVGSTTYYRSPDDSSLAIEVINNGGTLEPTGRQMPSTKTVDDKINERLVPGEYRPGYFPAFFDRNSMVPAWFDGGKFDVAGLGPNVTQVVSEIPNEWAQKFIPQGDFSPYYFP